MNDYKVKMEDGTEVMWSELKEEFDKVANPENWKMPVNRKVIKLMNYELPLLKGAVMFFTGSRVRVEYVGCSLWAVSFDGYYMSMGA